MEQNEQAVGEVREIRIGFTLIDIACVLTYIGLAVAMIVLYDFTAGLLLGAAGAVVGYATHGVTYRATMRYAGDSFEKMANAASHVMQLATAEIKDLKRQLDERNGT